MEEADQGLQPGQDPLWARGRGLKDGVAGICPRFQDASTGTALWAPGQHVSAPSALCAPITSVCSHGSTTRQLHAACSQGSPGTPPADPGVHSGPRLRSASDSLQQPASRQSQKTGL